MKARSVIREGVAAVSKGNPIIAPFVEFYEGIQQRGANIAFSKLLDSHGTALSQHQERLHIQGEILRRLLILFQGKGDEDDVREILMFQEGENNELIMLPRLFHHPQVLKKFLDMQGHFGKDVRVAPIHDDVSFDPDLIHFLTQGDRGETLMCQAPAGIVDIMLSWQNDLVGAERVNEQATSDRSQHQLGIGQFKQYEDFDFVYDRDGVPRERMSLFSPVMTLSGATRDLFIQVFASLRNRRIYKQIRKWDIDNMRYLTDITPEIAQMLIHGGPPPAPIPGLEPTTLNLSGLTSLSDEVAKILSYFGGYNIFLNGLTTISHEAAISLVTTRNAYDLSLSGLQFLSRDAFETLDAYVSLTDETREILIGLLDNNKVH